MLIEAVPDAFRNLEDFITEHGSVAVGAIIEAFAQFLFVPLCSSLLRNFTHIPSVRETR